MSHENIFKIRGLSSRFSSQNRSKRYIILFRLNKNTKPLEIESYCSCKSGARTIGGCCHSSAILSRITLGKYSEDIVKIRKKKRKKFDSVIDIRKKPKK